MYVSQNVLPGLIHEDSIPLLRHDFSSNSRQHLCLLYSPVISILTSCLPGRLGIFAQQIGRTVSAHHPLLVLDAELLEHGHGIGHHLVVARRTHNNSDLHSLSVFICKSTPKPGTPPGRAPLRRRSDPGIGPGDTKTDRHNISVMAVLSIRTECRPLAAPAPLRSWSGQSGAPGSEEQSCRPVVSCALAGRYCRFVS